MYGWVFFDFDGTIADSSEGIVNCIEYAEKAVGVTPPAGGRDLHDLIGPPLLEMIKKVYPSLGREQSLSMVEFYREEYERSGRHQMRLYPGIRELLEDLRARGVKLAVVSSKPEKFLRAICAEQKINSYFQNIVGVSLGEKPESKSLLLGRLIKDEKADPSSAVMVGDSAGDCRAAHDNGVPCIAVAYGFGCPEELRVQKPEFAAADVAELRKLLGA